MIPKAIWKSFRELFREPDGFERHRKIAEQVGIFDTAWYRAQNQDVDFSEITPFMHYACYGWRQGRDPAPRFNESVYSQLVPDFPPGEVCPVIDALERVGDRCLSKRTLKQSVSGTARIKPNEKREMLREGLSVTGYILSEIGLGQAVRNLIKAMDCVGIPVSLHDLPLSDRNNEREHSFRIRERRDRQANLLLLPVTELSRRRHELRPEVYSILYALWELPVIPQGLEREILRYDEVWTPSGYVARMFAPFGIKTTLVRQPLPIPDLSEGIGSRDGPLNVLTYFDFDSYVARKNIKAPVTAFQEAFPGQDDVMLTIKVRGERDNGLRPWLAEQASRDRRIRVIDSTLTRPEVDRLVMNCDAFLSLHRSEGFGFGAAEALAAGKAVVATDFSGTTDFITQETGYPVDYDLIPVREGEYPHWENQVWAEPRLDSAVSALRSIHSDRKTADEKGARGRELMKRLYSPQVVGEQIQRLLIERGLIG